MKASTTYLPEDGQSRVATLGRYAQAVGAATETPRSDTWDASDTNEPTTSMSATDESKTETIAAGSRMLKSISDPVTNPAFDELYGVTFKIEHSHTVDPLDSGFITRFQTTVTVEYRVDGGSWVDLGRNAVTFDSIPADNSSTFQEYTVNVDINDASPATSVEFRLKHFMDVSMKAGTTLHIAASYASVFERESGTWPTNAYDVEWTSLSGGSTQQRSGLKLFGSEDRPHIDVVPLPAADEPADAIGKDGDIYLGEEGRVHVHTGDVYGELVNTAKTHAAVRRDTDQTLTTAVNTTIIWETEIDDDGGNFDLANDKYVVPIDGVYLVVLTARFQTMTDLTFHRVQIYVGGNVVSHVSAKATVAQANTLNCTLLMSLSAADEITFKAIHYHGSNRVLQGGSGGGAHSRTVAEIIRVG